MKVCIDPGHGGGHPGAVYFGRKEKDATLAISHQLATELKAKGVDVVLTRTRDTDVSLAERCRISNAAKADLFISIHLNAAVDPTIHGAEVWKWYKSEIPYAARVQAALVEATGFKDRGVKNSHDFYVLRHTLCPALVVECGFMSNPREGEALFDPRVQDAIASGIATLFSYLF
jgi:N-acetylmuramoyl-L-alanine amidase